MKQIPLYIGNFDEQNIPNKDQFRVGNIYLEGGLENILDGIPEINLGDSKLLIKEAKISGYKIGVGVLYTLSGCVEFQQQELGSENSSTAYKKYKTYIVPSSAFNVINPHEKINDYDKDFIPMNYKGLKENHQIGIIEEKAFRNRLELQENCKIGPVLINKIKVEHNDNFNIYLVSGTYQIESRGIRHTALNFRDQPFDDLKEIFFDIEYLKDKDVQISKSIPKKVYFIGGATGAGLIICAGLGIYHNAPANNNNQDLLINIPKSVDLNKPSDISGPADMIQTIDMANKLEEKVKAPKPIIKLTEKSGKYCEFNRKSGNEDLYWCPRESYSPKEARKRFIEENPKYKLKNIKVRGKGDKKHSKNKYYLIKAKR